MRRTTEEQGHARAFTEYFPPRNKVEDFISQQHSRPYFAPFLQETPMKPSQLPDCLSHPPPRRMLPLQSPELCHKDRLGPRRHPPPPVLRTPPNIGPAVDRCQRMPRGSPAYRHHQHHEPPGYFSSSQFAPVSPTNKSSTFNRPASGFQSSFHQFMKDSSNHSQSVDIRKDQGTESKVTPSYSGIKNLTAQTRESNKAQSSDVSSPIPTVQLHRPPLTPSFYTSVVQEVCPVLLSGSEQKARDSQCPSSGYHPSPSTQSSDRSGGSSLPTMHNHVVTCQNQQHKRTPSSENVIPVVVSSCSFQKRRKKFDDCGNGAKKLCLPGINSHTPKPTVGNSFSTSLLPQPSSRHALVLEPSAKPTENHLCIEPLSGQSTPLELSSISKPTQTKPCIRRPSTGAKQVFINSTQELIKLRPSNQDEEGLKKRREETHKKDTPSSLLSSEVSQKDTGNSPHVQLSSHHSGHSHRTLVKTLSRGNHMEESRKSYSTTCKLASKANSASLSCRTIEPNKTARPRRPVAIPNDIDDLFTPDPMTSAAPSCQKSAKPKVDGIKPATSERSCSASSVTSSSTSVKTGTSHSVDTQVSPFVSQPFLVLKPVKLEKLKAICSKDRELKNGPIKSTGKQLKDESDRSDEKPTFLLNNMRPHTLDAGTTTAKTHCSQPPLLERQVIEGCKKLVNEEDPLDVELDLDLSFDLDMDLSQISHSSEEEQLLSLQEIMECVTKPPDTPEKGAFSEPSRPGHRSCESKTTLPSTTKSVIYKNNLDQMLEEININKKVKEIEIQIQTAWKEDLLRLAEYEEAEENQEEAISTEQQEFLQRYSLMANAIREVPPGEAVFALEKFGRLFDQDTLQLRRCMVKPQGTAQKTLLWSSPAQLRLHLNIGLFQEAYDCSSPCPTQVTHFLFKMMSVHSERMVSENILQALCDIACTAAYQIVKNGSQQFKVWVPSLADVVLVLMNMGVAFVTLFPFENLQPPFTEGDLLEDIYTKNESPSTNKEQFPEHNCNNILKYLSYCMGLCPRAYSDDELLLLLTVVGRLGLDTWLVLQSNVELCSLQYKIVNNIRDWDTMLPRICLAITDLTDDHHNMCLLVQLLPDNTRGKQLRGHLSLSMISKLLDGHCSYRPTEKDFQLSDLRPYLPRMQPSTLLRGMLRSSSRSQKDKGEHMATLDQRAYYLCYSLLTLANEASKFQFFPAHQKTQLLYLCSELETHIKCDIRESEKCLYRSKVKDLVARIYTKWQMLLQRTRPLHGKLYDYWQPLPADTLTSSQEDQEMDSSDGVEVPDEEDEEEDTSQTEEVIIIPENKEEGDCITDDANKKGGDMEPEEMKGDNAMDDTMETEESAETVHEEWGLN